MKITKKMLKAEYNKFKDEKLEIHEYNVRKWVKKISGIMMDEKLFGGCFYPKKLKPLCLKKDTIIIDKDLPNYIKLWVFYHETGHYLCNKKRCSCMKKRNDFKSGVKSEYHANLNLVRECIKNKHYEVFADFLKTLIFDFFSFIAVNNSGPEEIMMMPLRQVENDILYGEASKKLFKDKNFKEAVKILKKEKPKLLKQRLKKRGALRKFGTIEFCIKNINKMLKK